MSVKIANYAKVLIISRKNNQIMQGRYTGVKKTHRDESVKQKNLITVMINLLRQLEDVTSGSIFERNN